MNRNRWFAVAALTVAGVAFLVLTLSGIGENLVYYWGPRDVLAAGPRAVGATIRMGGQVGPGTIKQGTGVSNLEFQVVDGEAAVPVRSRGVPPQMFREGIGVVVEGTMTAGGFFECNRLMVSHDNEYRAPGDKTKADVRRLMKTTKEMDE